MRERLTQIVKLGVADPRCPSYFRLQAGHIVPLNDIRNENPYLDSAIATEINTGKIVGQGTLDRGIIVYQVKPSIDGYGIPPKK